MPEKFIYAKLFNKKTPLVIGWDLTYRCNFRCKYCGIPDSGNYPELSTEEVCSGIAQLRRMGTQRIHFGGGEVLLRDDLGEILALCRKNNITSAVLTNGFRFGERLADLQCADLVKISFDGDEPVHDELRGSGSFKK
jgi:Predicted Fe-S oxidoreductases